jgi:aldehyde dehydrogenase (NAD+)
VDYARLRAVLGEEKRFHTAWVNCYQAMDPAVPFGGYKMSGYGRESGKQHLEEYLNVKAVWIKTA